MIEQGLRECYDDAVIVRVLADATAAARKLVRSGPHERRWFGLVHAAVGFAGAPTTTYTARRDGRDDQRRRAEIADALGISAHTLGEYLSPMKHQKMPAAVFCRMLTDDCVLPECVRAWLLAAVSHEGGFTVARMGAGDGDELPAAERLARVLERLGEAAREIREGSDERSPGGVAFTEAEAREALDAIDGLLAEAGQLREFVRHRFGLAGNGSA
jgi:hypothetical protein